METWKEIDGFSNYKVSSLGRVCTKKGLILHTYPSQRGHRAVYLCKEGKHYSRFVHKLVALAFIQNPRNLPQVNHINEDKCDNRVENLEWCTAKYNLTYNGIRKKAGLTNRKRSKRVNMFDRNGTLVKQYESITDAAISMCSECYKKGVVNICNACNGRMPTAYGYKWSYA